MYEIMGRKTGRRGTNTRPIGFTTGGKVKK